MKVAVIGSRGADSSLFGSILEALPAGCSEIISGGAGGVDSLAKKAAERLHLKYTCLRPRYQRYGRAAPLYRNSAIVDRADFVLAFWDGRSPGTRQAISLCIRRRRPFRIYLFSMSGRLTKKSDYLPEE